MTTEEAIQALREWLHMMGYDKTDATPIEEAVVQAIDALDAVRRAALLAQEPATAPQTEPAQCDKQISIGNTSYLCLLPAGHEGICRRPALDALTGRDIDAQDLPSVETTRQAIIDALVKARVIGARQSVDRLIAAVEAKSDTNLIQPTAPQTDVALAALLKEMQSHVDARLAGGRSPLRIEQALIDAMGALRQLLSDQSATGKELAKARADYRAIESVFTSAVKQPQCGHDFTFAGMSDDGNQSKRIFCWQCRAEQAEALLSATEEAAFKVMEAVFERGWNAACRAKAMGNMDTFEAIRAEALIEFSQSNKE